VTRPLETWLAHLSDPAGLNRHAVPRPFADGDLASINILLEEALRHNVHLALHANALKVLQSDPQAFVTGLTGEKAAGLIARIRQERHAVLPSAMRVTAMARDLGPAIAHLPAVIVKGLDFAENAYGGTHLRSFGDVDILVRPDAIETLGDVLLMRGFRPHRHDQQDDDYTERQWINGEPEAATTVLVETHTDMVHAPELRRRGTLTYDLYCNPAFGGVTSAARLVLAALHGATSHLFARLQYVVDGMMIARTGVDALEVVERARLSGAVLPAYTMMRLAKEIYGCEASADLAARIRPSGIGRFERKLISAPMVLASKAPDRWKLLARRHAYRLLLRA
jgi:hypothetical protein